MKTLVLYDSNYGNTKIIAEAVSKELGKDTESVAVADFTFKDLEGVGLLVVGSPIIGWRPSERMGKFLTNLKAGQLKGIQATSFDTRINIFFHGDAAQKIAKSLTNAGARIVIPPEGFFVQGKEGPLVLGEKEKAVAWAGRICAVVAGNA